MCAAPAAAAPGCRRSRPCSPPYATPPPAREADGDGHKLDPELRLWLNSGQAARCSGPPLERPIALRGLRDMQEADASLLWLAEVEALPLPVVARRLGLDPATVGDELDQVRTLFRDRCHRAHLDTPLDAQCRSYARLLDAVTRSQAADTPGDLSRHLATCVRCAEAAACLRLHGGGLPAALAGWGRRLGRPRLPGAPLDAPPRSASAPAAPVRRRTPVTPRRAAAATGRCAAGCSPPPSCCRRSRSVCR
ncbi:hypothetical protein ACQ4WX_37120 [Streptomyces lasalocidi]